MLKSKSLLHVALLVVIASLLLNLSSAEAAGSLGTAFTYQGLLKDGSGTPITNTCDFHFGLYPAASGGSLVGGTSLQTLSNVAVNNGTFTVSLDFGSAAFNGDARWLEIGVRCPAGSGSYVPLTPRQPLTATPYALYSVTASTAANLSGVLPVTHGGTGSATQNFVDLNNAQSVGGAKTFTGAPSFNASGAPFSVSGSGSGLVTNLNADLLDGLHAASFQQHYSHLLVVAKSGGDFTSLTAALNSITNNSSSNMYLIQVAPGTYSEQVTMKPYVDIQGSGELNTKITWTGSSTDSTGTVVGADNSELRFLSVENTGGDKYAIAIYNSASSPRLTHVTASASGATDVYGVDNSYSSPAMTNVSVSASGDVSTNFGVVNDNSSPVMTDMAVTASGGPGSFNDGVVNYTSSPTMTNVSASASGGGLYNQGVHNFNSSPRMTNVSASGSGVSGSTNYGVNSYYYSSAIMTNVIASASGGVLSIGVYNESASSPMMTNVTASASGATANDGVYNLVFSAPTLINVTASATGGTYDYGVLNDNSSPTIQNSVITASGGSNVNDGIHNTGSAGGPLTVIVNNSQITGSSSSIWTDEATYTTRVGASQFVGTGGNGNGTYVCVFSYKGDYTPLSSTCQ